MVGNDIVDLKEAEKTSHWQHPRFLDKIFTISEQHYISKSPDAFKAIWELWSMKEAAYKLYVQQSPSRFYNPKKFICDLKGTINHITYLDFKCFVKTKITTEYILSEARLMDTEMTSKHLSLEKKHYHFQSETTRRQVLHTISKTQNLSKSSLKLVKTEFGVPKVYYNSELLNLCISITHHGNYGAFAIS